MLKTNKQGCRTLSQILVDIKLEPRTQRKIVLFPEPKTEENYEAWLEEIDNGYQEVKNSDLILHLPYRVKGGPIEWFDYKFSAPTQHTDYTRLVIRIYFQGRTYEGVIDEAEKGLRIKF